MTTSFKELDVWKKAHALVLKIYKTTTAFPKDEMFGLTSQYRRACVSIAANIAEGYKRRGKQDKLRFYNISQGSLEESRYYNLLAYDLKYISETFFEETEDEIELCSKLLNNYCSAIEKSK